MNEILTPLMAAWFPGALLLAVGIWAFSRFESQTKQRLQVIRGQIRTLELGLEGMERRSNSILGREKERQEKASAPIVLPVELTPLEKRTQLALTWSNTFRTELRKYSAAAGSPVEELITETHRLAEIEDGLRRSQSESDLDKAIDAEARLQQQLMAMLLSKSDRDIDPTRTNDAMQHSIDVLAECSRLTFIAPNPGAPVDKNLHILLGVDVGAGAGQRGLISSVRARGLMSANGVVVSQAEVRKYD